MDKSQEKRLVLWLKQQKHACGRFLSLSILLGVISGVATIAQAWLIASVLQGVIIELAPVDSFYYHFGAFGALVVIRAGLNYAREITCFEAGVRLRQQIRSAVLDKLTELGPAYIKGKPAGSWGSIVLEQVEDLHDFYGRYLPQMSLAAAIPLIILVMVFPINWASGLILLATAPLIPLFMVLVGMGAADANRKNFSALARLSGHFMDRLKGLATIKLFHRGEAETKQIEQASDEFRERTMTVLRLAFLSSAVLEFFAAVSIAVLAVYFGFSYLGHLDFGHYGASISLFTGLFVLILAPEFFQPLRDMGTHYHAKAQAVGAAEALIELLDYRVPSRDKNGEAEYEVPLHPEPEQASNQHTSGTLLPQIRQIQATELEVTTIEGKVLVGPLSFVVDWQQKLAIIGPSGAGKTSLLNALLGFLPYKGSIKLIDEHGEGVELREVELSQWRSQLAWLGQNPELFHGTIRDNINLGRGTPSRKTLDDEQIMGLLKQAKADQFVANLAQKLDHQVGEQGAGLSVGQAQRIALARAYGQDANFYLLDEPSASLDADSERLVSASLQQAMSEVSGVMVTHRLDQLHKMDQIMVIEAGNISQVGDYQSLSSQQGWLASALNDNLDRIKPKDMAEPNNLSANEMNDASAQDNEGGNV